MLELQGAGRKNAAGSWVREEISRRVTGAIALVMVSVGIAVGFSARNVPQVAAAVESTPWWLVPGSTILVGLAAAVALRLYLRIVDVTWVRGLDAEARVGDFIEHALTQGGCAFAHDVKEALGGGGNVDHVAMTPACVWVIETKARWVPKPRFAEALRQTQENVERVRRRLSTDLPVRGALVFADPTIESYEATHDWQGVPVLCIDAKGLWRMLRDERQAAVSAVDRTETARVRRMVWNLGSGGHGAPTA